MRRLACLCLLALIASACSTVAPQRAAQLRAYQLESGVLPMAAVAVDTGQLEVARRLYTRLLDLDDDSVAARMGMGNVAIQEGQPGIAARWYQSAANRADSADERHAALLAHGRAALTAGQLEIARNSFKRLTGPGENAARMTLAWAHNGVGLTLLLEGDLRGAIAEMELAVRRAPDERRFQANLERARAGAQSPRPPVTWAPEPVPVTSSSPAPPSPAPRVTPQPAPVEAPQPEPVAPPPAAPVETPQPEPVSISDIQSTVETPEPEPIAPPPEAPVEIAQPEPVASPPAAPVETPQPEPVSISDIQSTVETPEPVPAEVAEADSVTATGAAPVESPESESTQSESTEASAWVSDADREAGSLAAQQPGPTPIEAEAVPQPAPDATEDEVEPLVPFDQEDRSGQPESGQPEDVMESTEPDQDGSGNQAAAMVEPLAPIDQEGRNEQPEGGQPEDAMEPTAPDEDGSGDQAAEMVEPLAPFDQEDRSEQPESGQPEDVVESTESDQDGSGNQAAAMVEPLAPIDQEDRSGQPESGQPEDAMESAEPDEDGSGDRAAEMLEPLAPFDQEGRNEQPEGGQPEDAMEPTEPDEDGSGDQAAEMLEPLAPFDQEDRSEQPVVIAELVAPDQEDWGEQTATPAAAGQDESGEQAEAPEPFASDQDTGEQEGEQEEEAVDTSTNRSRADEPETGQSEVDRAEAEGLLEVGSEEDIRDGTDNAGVADGDADHTDFALDESEADEPEAMDVEDDGVRFGSELAQTGDGDVAQAGGGDVAPDADAGSDESAESDLPAGLDLALLYPADWREEPEWVEVVPTTPTVAGERGRSENGSNRPVGEPVHWFTASDGSYLQFGAFANKANADTVIEQVRAATEQPVFLSDTVSDSGRRLWRVRMGPILLRNALLNLVSELEAKGFVFSDPPEPEELTELVLTGPGNRPLNAELFQDNGQWFIKAGEFHELTTAETLATELRYLTNRPVQINEIAALDSSPIHRVRIGPLMRDDALIDLFQVAAD